MDKTFTVKGLENITSAQLEFLIHLSSQSRALSELMINIKTSNEDEQQELFNFYLDVYKKERDKPIKESEVLDKLVHLSALLKAQTELMMKVYIKDHPEHEKEMREFYKTMYATESSEARDRLFADWGNLDDLKIN
jgi:hypothetical protein